MDDALYDASFTLYTLSSSSLSLPALLSPSPANSDADHARLSTLATQFRDTLGRDRPRYEDEEEKEKIGSLRECAWTRLAGNAAAAAAPGGLLITLLYEKTSHKFILYHSPTKATPQSPRLTLLLAKSSPTTLKALTSFLDDSFSTTCYPLKPSSQCLQDTLQTYLTTVHASISPLAATRSLAPLVKSLFGTLKITITFNGPVAPELRSLDVDVPPETLLALLASPASSPSGTFLARLATHIHTRTGLKLPVQGAFAIPTSADANAADVSVQVQDPPLRISRLACAAYALSMDGRLKLAARAVEAYELVEGEVAEATGRRVRNAVRIANAALLGAVVGEAARILREEG